MRFVVSEALTSTIREVQSKSDMVVVKVESGRNKWALEPNGLETQACSSPAAMVRTLDSDACIEPAVDVWFTVGHGSEDMINNPFAVVAVIADRMITPKETMRSSFALEEMNAAPPMSIQPAPFVHVVEAKLALMYWANGLGMKVYLVHPLLPLALTLRTALS